MTGERKVRPVQLWAFAGALVLALEAYVLIRWITGPFFVPVPSGPSVPPAWMRAALIGIQVALPVISLALLYRYVVRPWRRERALGVDALMVIAFQTMCWQDPLSNYLAPWFTYNSWQVNRGSWVNDLPGALTFGRPGAMLAAPIFYVAGVYVPSFLIVVLLGSWVMRRAKARWPRLSKLELAGICFAVMVGYDFLLEGVLFMPLGVFTYAGGHYALFGDTYHKWPMNEALTTGAMFTIIACLRYFLDDRGRSVMERGIDQVPGSGARKLGLRLLATVAGVQLTMFFTYNVPNMWISLHSSVWPADIQGRSYFTDYLCGAGTDRACPGPAVPISRTGSLYITPTGEAATPPGTHLPPPVPFR